MSDHLSAAPAHSIICCLACSLAGTENSAFQFLRGSLRERYIARRGGGRKKSWELHFKPQARAVQDA